MRKRQRRVNCENKNHQKYKMGFYHYYSEMLYNIGNADTRTSRINEDVSREIITIKRQGKLTGICC